MVWFQCEDCGENLKKPKLPRHFSMCTATKLSCIDCGNMFGQDSVQWHNQCITEAEKYGPKGSSNGTSSNTKDDLKQQLDFDANGEFSNRPPWFCCRLCNAKTTCEDDFYAHVYGKKHQEKAKLYDAEQQKLFEQPALVTDSLMQLPDFDVNVGLSSSYPWFCSLCNINATSQQSLLNHASGKKHRENAESFDAKQQQRQSEQPTVDKGNSKQQPDFDINVGLSKAYPWFCSLCDVNANSKHSLLNHANGKKHREIAELFDAKQQQGQSEHSVVDKDNSKKQNEVDIYIGLSNCHPWFCSLCNTMANSLESLVSHADGKTHRENVEWFIANELQQSEQSTMDEKDKFENASNGISEQKKVDFPVPSGVANGYSRVDKKRKLETFDETWNGEVVQAEETKGELEKKSKSKKAKKQDPEKKGKEKQSELDSDFEYDKEDIKLLLVSYSKEELIKLVYKTAEKGSRLISAVLESVDRDMTQRNIFVRGFGWDTTHENLKTAFESYGEIEDCYVVMDKDTGRSKGYGFVLFKTRKGAREALRNPEKRMYNRNVVCNRASAKPCGAKKAQEKFEPVKIDLTQMASTSEAAVGLPGLELAHGHVLEQRHQQQQTMEMFGQNMPFYGHSQPPGFDPMYGALRGNQMVAGLPNYGMFGSGLMNQGPMLPPNHMAMGGQYFGDGEHGWYLR